MKSISSTLLLGGVLALFSLSFLPLKQVAAQDDPRGMRVQQASPTERRVALVIGNSAYKDSPLLNPVNDARDLAAALREFGFEVIFGENLSLEQMERNIRVFGEKIRNGGVGLFYYAGHGIQVRGSNYLIPAGATINIEEEIKYRSVDVGLVLAQMEDARNRLNIVILDACRNNPFARSFRSQQTGLASIDAPSGTLIAYATAPGSVASDGTGKNGLYTQELLKYMRIPEISIEQVFKRVRIAVREKTQGTQTPWESSSLVGDFYFRAASPEVKPMASEAQPVGAEAFIKKGDALVKEEKWAEAEALFRKAINLDPNNARLHVSLGYLLIKQKKYTEAEAEYRKAISLNPNYALAHNNLGNELRRQGKYTEAEAALRKAISLNPNYALAYTNLGYLFIKQQKYTEAEAILRKAINLDPNNALAYNNLALALVNQQKYTEAEAGFRKAVSLDPSNKGYQANLEKLLKEKR